MVDVDNNTPLSTTLGMTPQIDFSQIRLHRGDQATGFEELTRQLVMAEPLENVKDIEHRGAGADGGVEVLVRFKDGTSSGWQSKWFDALGVSQVAQLKDSFQSALKSYGADDKGRLTKFVVALPINLSGSGTGETSDARKRWIGFIAWAKKESAKALSRNVEIELWDETAFISRLQKHDGPYPGILAYWFDRSVFTAEWFRRHLNSAIAALDERYHPEDHVAVEGLRVFEVALHREVVRKDLRRDFNEVRAIYPVAADIAGKDVPPIESAPLTGLNTAMAGFLALEGAVNLPALERWPVEKWTDGWRKLLYERLQPIRESLLSSLEEKGHKWNSEPSQRLRRRMNLEAQQREAFGSPWHQFFSVEETNAILFFGEAGIGKSHLLAKAAEEALAEGNPALLFLGQDFLQGDPRTTILSRLDLENRSFEGFLGALDAAAVASNGRALIFIDALNEGNGLEIWPKELARLLEETRRFPRILLAVACRSEYLDVTIPKRVRQRFLGIPLRGFETFEEQERAAQVYLDRRGIVRPASPSLDPEFTNPLFLRIAAEALLRSNQNAFPRGLRGAKKVFQFVFETRGQFLGAGRDGTNDLVSPLLESLQSLAAAMAERRQDFLSIAEAASLVNIAFEAYPSPTGKTWLDILRGNGFLRKDLSVKQSEDEFVPRPEVIRFTFQRLADQLIAEALLRPLDQIDRAFQEDGALAFIVEHVVRVEKETGKSRKKSVVRHISVRSNWFGLCTAIWIAVAERFGKELIDLPGLRGDRNERLSWSGFSEPFKESLRWRVPEAFTKRTQQIAVWFFKDFGRERLPLYLEVALVPGHPWNMERLHAVLIRGKLPERDGHWSAALADPYGTAFRNARRISAWCQNADLSRADDETIKLAATTLGWFFTVTNRNLRDRATKALAAIFFHHPSIIEPTLRRFSSVDDEYVRERVFAAAYGAILHLRSNGTILAHCAKTAYEIVFRPKTICRHMTLRDYARGIIEVAAARNALPKDLDLERCKPPYRSTRITKWPTPLEVRRRTKRRGADSIFSSTVGWLDKTGRPSMAGDFGRYAMSGIARAFSAKPKTGKAPDSPGRRKEQFWEDVRKVSPSVARLANRFLRAHDEFTKQTKRTFPQIEIDKDDTLQVLIRHWDEKDPTIAAALAKMGDLEEKLVAALPARLKRRYNADKCMPAFGDDQPYHFDLIRGQCWVASRALDLGWSKELHGNAERYFLDRGDRMGHSVERIGKKYQWIAYNELCGFLIDHHWYFGDWGDDPIPFNWVDSFDKRDIDPSIWLDENIVGKLDRRIPILPKIVTDFQATSVNNAVAWTKSFDDLLDPTQVIEGVDADGERWWATHIWYRDNGYLGKLQSSEAFRTAQAVVSMIIVRQDDVDKFVTVSHGRNFGGESMLSGGDTMPVLMGEHAWDTGILNGDKKSRIDLTEEFHGVSYCVPSIRIATKRGEYDMSLTTDKSVTVPNGGLVAAMRLRVEGPKSYAFLENDGKAAFFDVEALPSDENRPVIRVAAFEKILVAQGLCPVWIFWGEKDGGLGRGPHFASRDSQFSRKAFGGCYWRESGIWKSSGPWRESR